MPTFTERLYLSAAKAVASRGVDVIFATTSSGSFDETAETGSDTSSDLVGKAVELPADPEEYRERELILGVHLTLIFVPSVLGQYPGSGATVTWAGVLRTVRAVMPYRPQGVALAAKVWVS